MVTALIGNIGSVTMSLLSVQPLDNPDPTFLQPWRWLLLARASQNEDYNISQSLKNVYLDLTFKVK